MKTRFLFSELNTSTKPAFYRFSVRLGLKPATVLLLSMAALTACQKAETTAAADDKVAKTAEQSGKNVQEVPVTVDTPASENEGNTQAVDTKNPSTNNTEVEVLPTDDIIAADAPSTPPPMPDPEVAITGTQISDVAYKNEAGQSLTVQYETSPEGTLKAVATLPSGKKVNLTAPAGQGNNPTYRSADGTIEVVSHGGGGSIDLVENGKITGFSATSAEAEVIPE